MAAYDISIGILTNVLHKMYPLRRLKGATVKFPRKPWITQAIRNSINKKMKFI